MRYFLSFVEECVTNPDYRDYVGGRVEVYRPKDEYASKEIRFFTKRRDDYYRFRDKWDFKTVWGWRLKRIERRIATDFMEAT